MHPRIVTVAVAGVVALTSVAGLQLWRGRPEQLEGVSRPELESLRQQLARVERSVARETGAPEIEDAAVPAADLQELRGELRAMREELGRLSRRISQQAPKRDAAWQSPSPAHLDEVLAGEAPTDDANRLSDVLRPAILEVLPEGASLRELVCRSSLCRIEISYPDLASYQRFVDGPLSGAKEALWNGPVFQELRSDPRSGDDVVGVVYFARDASLLR